MDAIDERFLVYTTIIFICSVLAALAGFTAGAATLLMIVAGVETAYWLGRPSGTTGHSGASS